MTSENGISRLIFDNEQGKGDERQERAMRDGTFRSRPMWRVKYADGSCRLKLTPMAVSALKAYREGDDAHHATAR